MPRSLQSLTKAELIKEVERLKGKSRSKPKIIRAKTLRPKNSIMAGMNIAKDDLLIVDEAKRLAYVHPEVKTVPNKVRIHGYAARSFKKGQVVTIRHWLTYEPRWKNELP